MKKRDANHWEKGDHSGARFDLCTVYGHIHTNTEGPLFRPVYMYIGIKILSLFGPTLVFPCIFLHASISWGERTSNTNHLSPGKVHLLGGRNNNKISPVPCLIHGDRLVET